jgi:hypothetical protein
MYATWMKPENIMLKWIKPDTKEQILYVFNYMKYLEQTNLKSQKAAEVTTKWKNELLNGYRVSVWNNEKILEIDNRMVVLYNIVNVINATELFT